MGTRAENIARMRAEQGYKGGMGAEQGKAEQGVLNKGTIIRITDVDMWGLNGRQYHPRPTDEGRLGYIKEMVERIPGADEFEPDAPDVLIYEVEMPLRGGTEILELACYEFDVIQTAD